MTRLAWASKVPPSAPSGGMMLNEQDTQSLCWLQWHWDSHYVIMVKEGAWMARRLRCPGLAPDGGANTISADSARGLRDKIKDDYAALVFSRQDPTAEGG